MDESVVKVFEQQQVGKLKLSEAIRIGAKLRPQCRGMLFRNGASCALGAAYEAINGHPGSEDHETNCNAMAFMYQCSTIPLSGVFLRNDSGQWTREQIADWLEAQGY